MTLRPLQPGDRIAVLAPASPFDPEAFERACEVLKGSGCEIVAGKHVLCKKRYLAGTEAERAEDLIRSLSDPSIGAVLCIRGGYGSGRLLPWLPFRTLQSSVKPFLGYSDITFLHLAFQSRMGWTTFHGPNLVDLAKQEERLPNVLQALRGESAFSWTLSDSQILRPGVATGKLIGGNLTCLAHLVGTPFFPKLDGALLLLEDRGEALYRLDRLLTHLRLAGLLHRLGGLVLGQFTQCGDPGEILSMILEQLQEFHFPILADLPFGHGVRNEVIPFGHPFHLDTSARALKAIGTVFERKCPAPAGQPLVPEINKFDPALQSYAPLGFREAQASRPARVPPRTPSLPPAALTPFAPLDFLFEEAIGRRTFSGASLLVSRPDAVLFEGRWGRTRFEGGKPITGRTLFDLASLTKPLITATLLIRAVSLGLIQLDDPLARFFARGELSSSRKGAITVCQLLNHCSGLPPYRPFYRDLIGVPEAERSRTLVSCILEDVPLQSAPGQSAAYSDLGFILLGEILERLAGEPLDRLASRVLLTPLGITELNFFRLKTSCTPTIPSVCPDRNGASFAATERCPWRCRMLEGEVHDENGYCLEGVAGHAGLFGTARGIFVLLSFLWNLYRGTVKSEEWSREVLAAFWNKPMLVPESSWALGFDTPSTGSSSAGHHFSDRSIGHLGFTGTSFWLDLKEEYLVILLTNRVHPTRENDGIKRFRPHLHNTVMEIVHGI